MVSKCVNRVHLPVNCLWANESLIKNGVAELK